MAIDTAAKRKSMLSFGSLDSLLFTPTGTVGAAARASLLDLYEGLGQTTFVGNKSITGILNTGHSLTGSLSTSINITGAVN